MKYSIIIPTLNEEKLLPSLLESLHDVKRMNHRSLEIVVSDGGSSDDTLAIAKKFSDKLLEHTNGDVRTISSGRARGAEEATGDILIFINADVRFDLGKLLEIVENRFLPHKYAALATKVKVFPEEESNSDKYMSVFLNGYFRFINFLGLGMGRGECQVIRKSTYNRVGGYRKDLGAGEDFELFTRVRREGKVLFIKDFVVYESPRRYHKWGYFKILIAWFLNSAASLLFKKSVYKSWDIVRILLIATLTHNVFKSVSV